MTPCPACAEQLETIRVLGETCDRLVRERVEMARRRDEWRKKAEGYDAVRLALREKVGAPWPPHLSRVMWAGIATDEKKRADDAEAERAVLLDAMTKIANGDAPMPIAETYRADGEPSKHDRCPHGQRIYEGCGSCIEDFASAALTEMQRVRGVLPGAAATSSGGGARCHPPADGE